MSHIDLTRKQTPPVTGDKRIPESETVYCSLYEKKKAFNAINNAASISTHYGPMYQLSY